MPTNIFILFFCIIVVLILSRVILLISLILAKKYYSDRELISPFECGFSPFLEARNLFSQRFFVLALIFVIFDVEIIMLLPFNLSLIHMFSLSRINYFYIFLLILILGLFNEWNQRILE